MHAALNEEEAQASSRGGEEDEVLSAERQRMDSKEAKAMQLGIAEDCCIEGWWGGDETNQEILFRFGYIGGCVGPFGGGCVSISILRHARVWPLGL